MLAAGGEQVNIIIQTIRIKGKADIFGICRNKVKIIAAATKRQIIHYLLTRAQCHIVW